jgi:hypothetical protein
VKLVLLCSIVLAAVASGAAHAARTSCGTYSIGPGAVRHGSTAGATCLLKAYRSCRPATYVLASFGVDTESTSAFHIVRVGPKCTVAVDATFRVVPQTPHRFHGTCNRIRRLAGDFVAAGCTGKLPATISLTGRH